MCGIVGYLGPRQAAGVLVGGLRRLESQSYDSAGLAVVDDRRLSVRKSTGRVSDLAALLESEPAAGRLGVAHTRWATHGRPSIANAHPHVDASGRIALVHNGIIENHVSIRSFLERQGVIFRSETDTEALVQLIGFFYSQTADLLESVRGALREARGAFGLALVCSDADDALIAARRGSPLIVGTGRDELFVASDASALMGRAAQVTHLDDNEIVLLGPDGFHAGTIDAKPVEKRLQPLNAVESTPLGRFTHHMQKEIFEQPDALRTTMRGRIRTGADRVVLGGLRDFARELPRFRRALLFACGSSWHASLAGKHLFEELAGVPADVEYASELRYRNPLIDEHTLAIAVSQSGETADTLAALRELRLRGAVTFGVVNSVGSTIARETDAGVYLHAGPEIGVASTKSFTTEVAVLLMIALDLGRRRRLSPERTAAILDELAAVPDQAAATLELDAQVSDLAQRLADRHNWLLLGRGINFPVALEGALKLKEVSARHAEGLPAAEIRHGPIAMIEAGMPVIVIAPHDRTHANVLANIEEVRSRQGYVVAIASEGDAQIARLADDVLFVPPTMAMLSPFVTTIPLQLLAYHTAVARGLDVDKPRPAAG